MILDIFFPVKPEPKLRARVVGTHAYTPAKTLHAEAELKYLVEGLLPQGFKMFEKPIQVQVMFYFDRPKSVSKKQSFPLGRPDLDNFAKLVFDAMNQIIWKDDSLIVYMVAAKLYVDKAAIKERGIRLTVSEIQESERKFI